MKNLVNTPFFWLLRRELWEHRGGILLAPLAISSLMIVLVLAAAIWGGIQMDAGTSGAVHLEGIRTASAGLSEMTKGYMASAIPLIIMLPFVTFFYCLSALYDDRHDKSAMFWASLPVSPTAMVLSKWVTAAIIIPVVFWVISALMFYIFVAIAAFFALMIGAPIDNASGLFVAAALAPWTVVLSLPSWVLWSLPSLGYCLLISAAVRRAPFLWATVPVAVVVATWAALTHMLGASSQVSSLMASAGSRLVQGLIPLPQLSLLKDPDVVSDSLLSLSYSWLSQPTQWLWPVVGVVFLGLAVVLRRRPLALG